MQVLNGLWHIARTQEGKDKKSHKIVFILYLATESSRVHFNHHCKQHTVIDMVVTLPVVAEAEVVTIQIMFDTILTTVSTSVSDENRGGISGADNKEGGGIGKEV